MPGDILPCHRFQFGIQRISIMMDFRHVVISDEAGTLTRRMPGRAGCQLPLFNQQSVCPAFLRKMLQQATAPHPALDDDDSRVFFHAAPIPLRPTVAVRLKAVPNI